MREIAAIKNITFRSLVSVPSLAAARLHALARPLREGLAFSAADERIAPERNLCVTIGEAEVSVAYGTRALSRLRMRGVRNYPSHERGWPQPRDAASAVVLAQREFGAAGAGVTLGIPKAWVITKTVEFPVAVKENLPDVIAYEFDRFMPFGPGEALYDFRVLGEEDGKIAVAIAAAKADPVNRYIEALGDKGIQVNRVVVSLSAMGTLCRYMGKEDASLFIEVWNEGYEGAFYRGGILAGAFSGNFPEADERSKVETLDAEIAAVLPGGGRGQAASPRVAALFRDSTVSMKEALKARLGLPFTVLGETEIKPGVPGGKTAGDIHYAAVGGVVEALWPRAKGMDLLKKGRYGKPGMPVTLTVLLGLALAAILAASVVAPLKVEEGRLAGINHQIDVRKGSIKGVEALQKEVDGLESEIADIRNFKERGPSSLTVLTELASILPKSAWLTRLRITDSAVEMEGYAASATELLPRLEASKYFRKVEFASPTLRDARMNSDRFNIKMEIKGLKDNKEKEGKGAPRKDGKK
ncbi:MAG TPA: PilN domain-containing protein [Dissulfurispiraceae bacterium]